MRRNVVHPQSIRIINELTGAYISMRRTDQNFIVNMPIVRREVIEDARRYIPQPIFLGSLFKKVTKEKIPLTRPTTNIIMVIPAAACTIVDCLIKDSPGWIWLCKISLIVKPILFLRESHPSPTTQLLCSLTKQI